MSENELQRSLVYLYGHIDRYRLYAPELFAKFALSEDDLQVIKDLMTVQREGLLLQTELSREKWRDVVVESLPASFTLAKACLLSVLDKFPRHESFGGIAATISAFADHAKRACSAAITRELELVHFEARHASIALHSPATRPTFAVIRSSYDVYGTAHSHAWPETDVPHCFFLFQAPDSQVRILIVAPRLADLLSLFEKGLSRGEVMQTLESEQERAVADASIEKLVLAGAPIA